MAVLFLGLPLLAMIVGGVLGTVQPARRQSTPARAYPESIFSSWDGSNANLVKYVKQRMNDPGSFEHAETRFAERDGNLFVTMKYRGKNAFGGVVTNYVNAKMDRQGNIIDILDDDEAIKQAYVKPNAPISKLSTDKPVSVTIENEHASAAPEPLKLHPILNKFPQRDWTYLDGRPFTRGVYIGYKPTDVWIMNANGEVLKTSLFGLSKANQDFVRKEIREGRKSFLIPQIEKEGISPVSE